MPGMLVEVPYTQEAKSAPSPGHFLGWRVVPGILMLCISTVQGENRSSWALCMCVHRNLGCRLGWFSVNTFE